MARGTSLDHCRCSCRLGSSTTASIRLEEHRRTDATGTFETAQSPPDDEVVGRPGTRTVKRRRPTSRHERTANVQHGFLSGSVGDPRLSSTVSTAATWVIGSFRVAIVCSPRRRLQRRWQHEVEYCFLTTPLVTSKMSRASPSRSDGPTVRARPSSARSARLSSSPLAELFWFCPTRSGSTGGTVPATAGLGVGRYRCPEQQPRQGRSPSASYRPDDVGAASDSPLAAETDVDSVR